VTDIERRIGLAAGIVRNG